MTTVIYTPQTSNLILQKIAQYISQNPSGYIDIDNRIMNLNEDDLDIDKINQKIIQYENWDGEYVDLDSYISKRIWSIK